MAPSLEEKPYLLSDYVSEHVGHMDMRTLSALPKGLDRAEWIASNSECPGGDQPAAGGFTFVKIYDICG